MTVSIHGWEWLWLLLLMFAWHFLAGFFRAMWADVMRWRRTR